MKPNGGGGPAPKEQWTAYVQTAAALGAGVVGLTAYVYLLGGIVMWLRMTAARLPSDAATEAFQNRQLLSLGMKALVFEVILLAILGAIVWGAWWVAKRIDTRRRQREREAGKTPRGPKTKEGHDKPLDQYVFLVIVRLLLTAIFVFAVVVNTFGLYDATEGVALFLLIAGTSLVIGAIDIAERQPGWFSALMKTRAAKRTRVALQVIASLAVSAVAFFLMAAPLGLTTLVLLILLQFSEKIVHLTTVSSVKGLFVPVLILGAALNLVILPYLATPPVTFDRVEVLTTENEVVTGAFIGRSSDGVFLATCRRVAATKGTEARLHVVPSEKVKEVTLGGFGYNFDFGKRPSLFELSAYFLARDPIDDEDSADLQLDLRGERSVCGKPMDPGV